jgi:hypothetical protein
MNCGIKQPLSGSNPKIKGVTKGASGERATSSPLPSATQSVVELHQREPLVEFCLRQIELR